MAIVDGISRNGKYAACGQRFWRKHQTAPEGRLQGCPTPPPQLDVLPQPCDNASSFAEESVTLTKPVLEEAQPGTPNVRRRSPEEVWRAS